MATVTGYTAAKIDELMDDQVIDAEVNVGGHLIFTTRGGVPIDAGVVKGATGATGPKGDAGDVASGGYVGTLQDAVDEVKAYAEDTSGKGLVAATEYSTGTTTFGGGDDSLLTLSNPSCTYADFEVGRSYRIDFGVHVSFGPLGTIDNIVSLDLMDGATMLRRVTIPGDEEGHQSGLTGSHLIKSCVWSGANTFTLRLQKRTGADVVVLHSTIPSFIAITDLGNRFA